MKNKIILIGYLSDKKFYYGPENVLVNLIEEFKKNNANFIFINTYTSKIALIKNIFKLIFCTNCDINVHSFGYKIPFVVFLISKINFRNRYYLTLHGLMSLEKKYYSVEISKLNLYMEKKLIEEFPKIVCVSNSQLNILKNKYIRDKDTFIIYNGINTNDKLNVIEKNKCSIKIVMAGGIYNIKGIFEVIRFVKYYNENNNNKIYLDIYGGIETTDVLKEFNNKLNKYCINKYIKYLGKINSDVLLERISTANFIIALSKFDTFNMTVLEGMSVGTPAIISEEVGISELIRNEIDGFVINMHKDFCKEITDKINKIIANPKLYNKMCENAYSLSKRYNWERAYNSYIDVFEN